jgi:hypothetical protein
MNCVIPDTDWMDYLDQSLSFRDRQRIDGHLRACARCRAELDALRQVDQRLRIECGLLAQSVTLPEATQQAAENFLAILREGSPTMAHDRLWRVRWVLALLCGSNTATRIIDAAQRQTETARPADQRWTLFLRRLAFITTEICGSYAGELIWAVGQ